MINDAVKQNFGTVLNAAENKRLCVMECKRKKDGEIVNLICAITYEGKEVVMLPLAEMMTGNPYEDYFPPAKDGGFFEDLTCWK